MPHCCNGEYGEEMMHKTAIMETTDWRAQFITEQQIHILTSCK